MKHISWMTNTIAGNVADVNEALSARRDIAKFHKYAVVHDASDTSIVNPIDSKRLFSIRRMTSRISIRVVMRDTSGISMGVRMRTAPGIIMRVVT